MTEFYVKSVAGNFHRDLAAEPLCCLVDSHRHAVDCSLHTQTPTLFINFMHTQYTRMHAAVKCPLSCWEAGILDSCNQTSTLIG